MVIRVDRKDFEGLRTPSYEATIDFEKKEVRIGYDGYLHMTYVYSDLIDEFEEDMRTFEYDFPLWSASLSPRPGWTLILTNRGNKDE